MLTTTGLLHLYMRCGGNRLTHKLRTSQTEKEMNERIRMERKVIEFYVSLSLSLFCFIFLNFLFVFCYLALKDIEPTQFSLARLNSKAKEEEEKRKLVK